jgi:hypothetical protein
MFVWFLFLHLAGVARASVYLKSLSLHQQFPALTLLLSHTTPLNNSTTAARPIPRSTLRINLSMSTTVSTVTSSTARTAQGATTIRVLCHLWQSMLPPLSLLDHGIRSHKWEAKISHLRGLSKHGVQADSHCLSNCLGLALNFQVQGQLHPHLLQGLLNPLHCSNTTTFISSISR